MSVEITGKYVGNKRITLVHGPSDAEMNTDAPKDNNGEGRSFSPTDLIAASLGSCTMTVMAIVAERDGIDLAGMHMHIEKHMNASPRRIGKLPLTIHMPASLGDEERNKLEKVAKGCPVHHSLHPDVEAPITFVYDA